MKMFNRRLVGPNGLPQCNIFQAVEEGTDEGCQIVLWGTDNGLVISKPLAADTTLKDDLPLANKEHN